MPLPTNGKAMQSEWSTGKSNLLRDFQKQEIEKDPQKINLMFVLEGKENTIQRFPAGECHPGMHSQLVNDDSFLSGSVPCLPS
ncbi:hypothetical protein NXW50_30965 [Bacteroides thetaiotaomicron]|nr:hypothetical protein [Bacteroides thetaiotaomicron]MCS2282387.1 hypothetical protein [Bacteroides thetaiotaomicron]